VPGVGTITKERLQKHDYISITTAEQLFGFFLYKTRPGVTSSAPRMGRCDEFKTWLTNDCSVRGQEANKILKAFLDKAEKVCIHSAGTEYGRVSELSGSGSDTHTHTHQDQDQDHNLLLRSTITKPSRTSQSKKCPEWES